MINKATGDFTFEDTEILHFIAGYVAIAIENSLLYERVKKAKKAKTKAISHLSHELKTPLAIIRTAFQQIKKRAMQKDLTGCTNRPNGG